MFKCCLAESLDDNPLKFPKLASIKLDGIRVVTMGGKTLTRSNKDVPNKYIRETLAPYQFLDGEIIIGEASDPDCYRNTNSGVMSHEGSPKFTYWVFDDLTNLTAAYEDRLKALQAQPLPPFIKVLSQTLVTSPDEVDEFYATSLTQGFEGAILRDPKAPYKYGRYTAKSQGMLKMKPFSDDDAEILSVYEAEHNDNEAYTNELGYTERSSAQAGKVGAGMAGGFVCKNLKDGQTIRVAAGKLTHAERTIVWEKQEEYVGQILKFRHMGYGVKDLPRFPRFIGWRFGVDL